MFRAVCFVMLVLQLVVLGLQYNDPDPLLWALVYGYGAIATALAILGHHTILAPLGALAHLAGFFYLIRFWGGPWLYNESVREAFGLLIVAVWLGVLSVPWLRRRRSKRENGNRKTPAGAGEKE